MGLDKANIFKLKTSEFKKYKEDPFLDCFESTKDFAKALMHDIETKETPHSLLLSADFGMGKTFFSTRFAQFLKNNKYDVIYFSVWENDYFIDPFLAFSKVIVNYIHNRFKAEKYKANLEKLFGVTKKVVESLSLNFTCGVSISSKDLIEGFKEIDPIVEFRKKLTTFISKIPKKKLIIIVDELDRCRPDYAMKVLECIKHFFDIEGLFVIIPTNKKALDNGIKALYNLEDCNSKLCESYSQKFFNDERIIKNPTQDDYLFVINQYLTDERLQEALDKNLLSKNDVDFNSYKNLRNYFAKYSYQAGLTVRELKDFSLELARICNNFYEPVRTEWLTCVFANKDKQESSNFMYPVPIEHCFYKERHVSFENSKNGKSNLFNLSEYVTAFRNFGKVNSTHFHYNVAPQRLYANFLDNYQKIPQNIKTYLDAEQFFTEVLSSIKDLEDSNVMPPVVLKNVQILKEKIEHQKSLIQKYQKLYGSDDNDIERREKYIKIVKAPEILYSVTC